MAVSVSQAHMVLNPERLFAGGGPLGHPKVYINLVRLTLSFLHFCSHILDPHRTNPVPGRAGKIILSSIHRSLADRLFALFRAILVIGESQAFMTRTSQI